MKTSEVIEYFGTVKLTSKALKCSTQAIYKWGLEPPRNRQYEIEVLTDGKLKARRKWRTWAPVSERDAFDMVVNR